MENTLKIAESLGIPNSDFSVLKMINTTLPYQSKKGFQIRGKQEFESKKLTPLSFNLLLSLIIICKIV